MKLPTLPPRIRGSLLRSKRSPSRLLSTGITYPHQRCLAAVDAVICDNIHSAMRHSSFTVSMCAARSCGNASGVQKVRRNLGQDILMKVRTFSRQKAVGIPRCRNMSSRMLAVVGTDSEGAKSMGSSEANCDHDEDELVRGYAK